MTEREELSFVTRLVEAGFNDLEQLKNKIVAKEKLILEDINFLRKAPRWRAIVATPDMLFARFQYRKMVKQFNMRASIMEALIREAARLKDQLHEESQFNQSFE